MRRSTVIGIAVVATVAFVGPRAMANRGDSTAASNTPPATRAPAVAVVSPVTTDEHGVPGGWSHDPAGAVDAAVSAVRLTGSIARAGFITRSDMIAVLASERY